MSDITVPSYRVRPQRAGFQVPWRMLAVSGAVLGIAAAGGGVVWGITRAVNRSVPTIEADARPIRVKPDDPGGMRVANQDEITSTSRPTLGTEDPADPWAGIPRVNVLLLGADGAAARSDEFSVRTDTIILASIDTVTGDTRELPVQRVFVAIGHDPR